MATARQQMGEPVIYQYGEVIVEHYPDGMVITKAPDWDKRIRVLKNILDFLPEEKRLRILEKIHIDEEKFAKHLAVTIHESQKEFVRRSAQKKRWTILKRDNFTCQYCGRKAPEVVLNVDHKLPVCKGGTSDESNLITSCFECNHGKATEET